MAEHVFQTRVYYEDTDANNIVYYANYLKYTERARTELLREVGFESKDAIAKGEGFVVADLNIQYKASAKLDDIVDVRTRVLEIKPTRIILEQDIYKDEVRLTATQISLAYIDLEKGIRKIPQELVNLLEGYK